MCNRQSVNIDHARYDDQRRLMQQIIDEGKCPFCRENLFRYHKQPILRETRHWIVTLNQWPYEHTKHHFLLIAREHVEDMSKFPITAGSDVFLLISWIAKRYGVTSGALVMRFGDTRFNGATVSHLHVHVVIPDIESADFQKIRFKVGTRPDLEQKNDPHRLR